MTPVSCAVFSTSAETWQFGSPISTTCELVRPTDETRPTRPSAVSTGRLVAMPSRLPRSIWTVCHQLAGSRTTTLASLVSTGLAAASRAAGASWSFSRSDGVGLHGADLQLLVFAAELFVLLEQFAAGQDGVAGVSRAVAGRSWPGQTGAEKAADGELEAGSPRDAAGSKQSASPAPPGPSAI